MKICIDCTLLRQGRVSGVERYMIELVDALMTENNQSDDLFFVLLFNKNYNVPIRWRNFNRFETVHLPTSNRVLNDQIFLPLMSFLRKDISLYHFPVFASSLFFFKPFVITNHDSTFWRYPDTISWGAKIYYKPLYKRSLNRCKQIICVSDSSRNDLIKYANVNENNITVIYEALSSTFKNINVDNAADVISRFAVSAPYILSVGTLEPRKNIKTLLSTFDILLRNDSLKYNLVIVGRKGWGGIEYLSNSSNVIYTGFVDDIELKALYLESALFIFPSLYEGFGFPILEAMHCNVPVLATNSSSIPEIGGNACEYINDPLDPLEIANKITVLLNDDTKLDGLRELGQQNLMKFSWRKTALETMNIYKRFI